MVERVGPLESVVVSVIYPYTFPDSYIPVNSGDSNPTVCICSNSGKNKIVLNWPVIIMGSWNTELNTSSLNVMAYCRIFRVKSQEVHSLKVCP